MTSINHASRIVIIGAGCFGLSTGHHLLKRGYKHVLVLDRASQLPAPDAASTDISKSAYSRSSMSAVLTNTLSVVRSSYADIFYTRLAREAISEWKNTQEWADTYREFVVPGLCCEPSL